MRAIKQLLWWLIAGSEGGVNRARIIHALNDMPCNANQLAEKMELDYKTVRHHLDVLVKNNMITFRGEKYGRMYFISQLLEEDFEIFEEIWARFGNKKVNEEKNRGVKR